MGVMTFEEWCSYKKMVMGETPAWFDLPAERRRRYEEYRIAFEENCSAANPLDAAFAPATHRPLHAILAPVPSRPHVELKRSYSSKIQTAALAFLVQIMPFVATARS